MQAAGHINQMLDAQPVPVFRSFRNVFVDGVRKGDLVLEEKKRDGGTGELLRQ